MALERLVRIRLLRPHTHRGIELQPGTEIEVDEARATRMVGLEIAEKLEVFIVEIPEPEAEAEPSPQGELDLSEGEELEEVELEELDDEAEEDDDGDEAEKD